MGCPCQCIVQEFRTKVTLDIDEDCKLNNIVVNFKYEKCPGNKNITAVDSYLINDYSSYIDIFQKLADHFKSVKTEELCLSKLDYIFRLRIYW